MNCTAICCRFLVLSSMDVAQAETYSSACRMWLSSSPDELARVRLDVKQKIIPVRGLANTTRSKITPAARQSGKSGFIRCILASRFIWMRRTL
ncbi:MAG: hypothetical protein WCK35_26480, partial [Chloroflexota bacterium]